VQSAKDLDGCCLTLQQLQRLAEIEDVQKLKAVLTGCFVRINSCGAHNKFEVVFWNTIGNKTEDFSTILANPCTA